MELSVVVPVHNEADNVAPLIAEIAAALDGRLDYEIVYVDDGSVDGTVAALLALKATRPRLRVVRHQARCGQSAAIRTGVAAARAPWIATLDGDGQNDPADIPSLWTLRRDGGAVMIAGERTKRRDSWSKRLSSRWANRIRASLLHDHTRDTGCGLKLFPRALFLELPYFDHMHRFLGALMIRQGAEVLSVPVNHRPRLKGASKYGFWDRLWVGISDLAGVMWLQRRAHIPRATED
ncbi:MAG TPA: glycosyltransferase family 2 protein [Candidatus Sulfotelmatobacter sp.]|nr:glycosyltransferase family 2 protein [Candidatus Sulfotelmatobacter sp.]